MGAVIVSPTSRVMLCADREAFGTFCTRGVQVRMGMHWIEHGGDHPWRILVFHSLVIM